MPRCTRVHATLRAKKPMPELLEAVEAVDAAEANGSCLHGGKRMRMKSESRCRKVIGFLGYHLVVASQHGGSVGDLVHVFLSLSSCSSRSSLSRLKYFFSRSALSLYHPFCPQRIYHPSCAHIYAQHQYSSHSTMHNLSEIVSLHPSSFLIPCVNISDL